MSDTSAERPQIVLLFGCSDAVHEQVQIKEAWASNLLRPHQVFALDVNNSLGDWWRMGEYAKYFEANTGRLEFVGNYIWQAVNAQFMLEAFEYYEGWQADVSLVILGEYYQVTSPVVRQVFTELFPKARFFESAAHAIRDELWVDDPLQDADSRSITVLELSSRAENQLARSNINTIGQLTVKSAGELLDEVPNFGPAMLEEVIEALRRQGLDLRAD